MGLNWYTKKWFEAVSVMQIVRGSVSVYLATDILAYGVVSTGSAAVTVVQENEDDMRMQDGQI